MHLICCAACITPSRRSMHQSTNVSRPWR
jgi:hypothetical protein